MKKSVWCNMLAVAAALLIAQAGVSFALATGCPLPSSASTTGIPSPLSFVTVFNNGYNGHPNGGSYMKVTIAPNSPYVGGDYLAWCSDAAADILTSNPYIANLIDSKFTMCPDAVHDTACVSATIYRPDPSLPPPDDCVWNEINYLINHKQGNADSVQVAIWDLISPPDVHALATTPNYIQAEVDAMVAAAQAHSGYVLASGDMRAAVLYVNDTVQNVFIEIPPSGNTCGGQIGDFVWKDLNGNGLQDAGEPGINGVVVNLMDSANNVVATTTTITFNGHDGYYQFIGLCAGTYKVVVDSTTVPTGLTQTTTPGSSNGNDNVGNDSNNPGGTTVILGNGDSIQTIDFGYQSPCSGKIGDFVWNDLNGNGCQDAGEPGISGVIVELYTDCANPVLKATTTTDSNGKYVFDNLCAGNYSVRFHTPAGFVHTLALQSCNIGSQPSDETDSNCDCSGADDCSVCVNLPTDNAQNLSIDCGYIGQSPCLTLVKEADNTTTNAGAQMGYTYSITNCGNTIYTNLAIVDDAGTPGVPGDDFTVASGINLLPGQAASFHVVVTLPIPLCAGTSLDPSAGTLIVQVLANGDVKVTLRQSRNLNDNVYGTPAPADGWASGHTFGNLTGSDKAEFKFTDSKGNVVLDFYCDYVSATNVSTTYPSGYASLGPNGGDGSLVSGAKSNVLSWTSTLADSLNNPLNYPPSNIVSTTRWIVNSPTPEMSFPNWDYVDGYTVVVSHFAFGANGFGGVTIPYIHNSPAKMGNNQVSPTPCTACITNIAKIVTVTGGSMESVLDADDAVVCTGNPTPPPPACVITKGALKIDKQTVQLPLKNAGTSDIFLTELDLSWLQSINGKLKKISLNGDVWAGLSDSPAALTTTDFNAFNTDTNRRKIAKGQTKTLVLTFEKNADKVVADYTMGAAKFGTACSITVP